MTAVENVTGPISSFDPYERGCPSRDLLDQIGSKWAVLVLGELGRNGMSRFGRLRQALAGVSEKMLAQTLRTLERDGLVSRTVHAEVPPHVEYELTALGQTLREPLKALTQWSVLHIEEVITARQEYDDRGERSR
ncbi:winged helix-turn-helix transcriptional regulator [Actinacidiphila paucisporea]|uniref:Transcriptional regulator, HxlR family n=1 Tax=Actinacidiphila paucisporea TaxID=310782 RepID=A0A1M7MNP3_9ACTN|nr:helix-turn-helix domain-containing protein [Actinacidiphila paucisporea]SHM92540.1 transcriptional regulator, HxlR family [Actinacidiphila paucisporea]